MRDDHDNHQHDDQHHAPAPPTPGDLLTPKQAAALQKLESLGSAAGDIAGKAATTCDHCGAGTDIFKEREAQIVREMCNWWRDTAAPDPNLGIRFIAGLAEVRSLRDALDTRARQGETARKALFAGSSTTTAEESAARRDHGKGSTE